MIVHNLPPQSNSFLDRKVERAEVVERLIDPHCQLLTIVGPGDIGKTRLAIQLSSDVIEPKAPQRLLFQDGVYFVSLQPLISSDFNLSVIADSLKLQFSRDSAPVSNSSSCPCTGTQSPSKLGLNPSSIPDS